MWYNAFVQTCAKGFYVYFFLYITPLIRRRNEKKSSFVNDTKGEPLNPFKANVWFW